MYQVTGYLRGLKEPPRTQSLQRGKLYIGETWLTKVNVTSYGTNLHYVPTDIMPANDTIPPV